MKKVLSGSVVVLVLGLFGCSKQPESLAVAIHPVQVRQATLSPSERAHVLDGDFTIIRTTIAIPERCKSAFVAITRDGKLDMADPGQEFQVTDVVVDKGLPWRRLIFAGVSRDKCFLHYEHGGIAHSYYVVVFDTSEQNETKFLSGVFIGRATDLQQLRAEINKGEFVGEYHHW